MTQPSNIPILYQNIMLGLSSHYAQDAFLWAVDRPGECRMCYRAESFAREVDLLVASLGVLLPMAAQNSHGIGDGTTPPGLLTFILTRHANWRYGGNLNPTYARGIPNGH